MTGNMTKPVGIALLVLGVILLVVGFNESNSFASDVNRVFNNAPTDRAMWFMIGGGVSAVLGVFFLMKRG
jgi:hypothetical protein